LGIWDLGLEIGDWGFGIGDWRSGIDDFSFHFVFSTSH
jgi:hypothetical protein